MVLLIEISTIFLDLVYITNKLIYKILFFISYVIFRIYLMTKILMVLIDNQINN